MIHAINHLQVLYCSGLCNTQYYPVYVHRVRLEGGFKNRNRKPDFPEDNSGSYYRNRNTFFYIPVPVNPERESQFLVSVLGQPEL